MTYAIPIHNGILTMCETDFKCPECGHLHHEDDWYPKLDKYKTGLIYIKCKGCKIKLGVTTCMMGDVRVWDKRVEK